MAVMVRAVAMATDSLRTQIAVIQSKDGDLVQTQVNVNTIFRGIADRIMKFQDAFSQQDIIGEVKFANISLNQFQAIAGADWVLANGQPCVGSAYAGLTKNNNVPTISITGANAFIRVN